jgi:stage IV sporulation protein FB
MYGLIFIFIHELCHIICAHFLGYTLKSITILPFGITANINEEFIKPADDIKITISGPLINFIFFILFFLLEIKGIYYCKNLKEINLILFVFNMMPADFLDGGRILKTILKFSLSFYSAYITTIITGIILAIIILFASIYTKTLLNGIILFVVAFYMLFNCYKSKREILIKLIKDTIFKNMYTAQCSKIDIRLKAFKGEVKIIDIIKYFCFKKYYIIYLIEDGILVYKFNEIDIIKIYCVHGNLKLEECTKYLNT